ncbi:MAG: hypothetical protein ACKO1Y_08845 [Actinomycetota bacterium]
MPGVRARDGGIAEDEFVDVTGGEAAQRGPGKDIAREDGAPGDSRRH